MCFRDVVWPAAFRRRVPVGISEGRAPDRSSNEFGCQRLETSIETLLVV